MRDPLVQQQTKPKHVQEPVVKTRRYVSFKMHRAFRFILSLVACKYKIDVATILAMPCLVFLV